MMWSLVLVLLSVRLMLVVPAAVFSADQGTPRTGDPITLTLTVHTAADEQVIFPVFPTVWSPFQVLSVEPTTSQVEAGGMVWRQVIHVVLWRPGDVQTPETTVEVRGADGTSEIITVQPVFLSVPAVLNEDDLALRPLKPPIRMPEFPVGVVVALLAAVVGGGALVWRQVRKRPPAERMPVNRKVHPAADVALRELRDLAAQKNLSTEERLGRTADCLRRYVRTRFGVPAPERTTHEVVSEMTPVRGLSQEQQRRFRQLLGLADWAKFSGAGVADRQGEACIQQAQVWIREVERGGVLEEGE